MLYQDASVIAVNKPAGLLSVPGRGEDKQDCLSGRLQVSFPDTLVIHRLDMDTSGVMLFARDIECQRKLSALFANRQVIKHYRALVNGCVDADEGKIDYPLAADWPNRPRQKIDYDNGKASLTRWQKISVDSNNKVTELMLFPETGRSHQLRVHLHAIGHPVLGDPLYCVYNPVQKSSDMAPRLMLHACYVEFIHPVDQTRVQIDCPMDLQKIYRESQVT